MRGDSLRDLYAKTLALLGLGVLAGTGALVDYWPTGIELPTVDSALTLPQVAVARPASAFETTPIGVARERATTRSAPTAPGVLRVSRMSSLNFAAAEPVTLREPPPAPFAPVAVFASAGEEVSLSDPMPFDSARSYRAGPMALMSDDAQSDADKNGSDGFLTGAMKRTGNSIVKTSVKTGASIVDAFRAVSGAVGGAVRKALPD